MNLFKRTALTILAIFFLNIIISSIIEMNALTTSKHNIETAINIAGKYAVESFEITQYSGFDDNLGSNYDISDNHNQMALEQYYDEIERQSFIEGINTEGSDFRLTLEFLRNELDEYRSGNTSSVLSPFAFSWTFVEEERLNREFADTINRIVQANYNPGADVDDKALAFSGRNVLRITDTNARIVNGPTLINLTEGLDPSSPTYKTYLSIFGTSRNEAMMMYNNMNDIQQMYNYMIVYDVEYTVNWEHHTTTTFFKGTIPFVNGDVPIFPPEYIDENDQIILTMSPITYTKRYVVIN